MANNDNEVYDVLSLASSINQDIHEFNRNAMPGTTLGMSVVNPNKILADIPHAAIPQRPPQLNIEGMNVSGPTPLIPLTEVYPDGKIPQHLIAPPPIPSNHILSTPTTLQVPQPPPMPTPQMEFNFIDELLKSKTTQEYIDEKFLKIEIKLNKIYTLLTDIMTRKKRKQSNDEKL